MNITPAERLARVGFGHGWLAMLACCIPMVILLALIGFKVI